MIIVVVDDGSNDYWTVHVTIIGRESTAPRKVSSAERS